MFSMTKSCLWTKRVNLKLFKKFFIYLIISLFTIDFKNNLRIKNFERHMKSLDTRCKELNDRFESVRPVTSNEVIFFEIFLSI
jgi:hypothetical protein